MSEILKQANEYVEQLEEEWLKRKWEEYSIYQSDPVCEHIAQEVLEEIEIEMDRIYPGWRKDERI